MDALFSGEKILPFLLGGLLLLVGAGLDRMATAQTQAERLLVVDDFEGHDVGSFPEGWVFVTESKEVKSYEETRDRGEKLW